MKKPILSIALLAFGSIASFGQINQGGLPLSMVSNEPVIAGQRVSTVTIQAPTLESVLSNDAKIQLTKPNPDRGGIFIPTDISFPESGSFVTLSDGRLIWRAQFQVTNAPSIGLYYDKFNLPAGVKYYITNGNNKEVLGAYTSENNSSDNMFATQMMQGNVANLEIDIPQNVQPSDIKLHINRVAYMYKGYNYLNQYAEDGATGAKPTIDPFDGTSATCMVNSICTQGSNYPQARKSVARIMVDIGDGTVGFCTATLINNTSQDCKPYLLTATHCDENNNKTNSAFNQWIFFFNFEKPDCAGTGNASDQSTMVGADFIARADYDHTSSSLIGDFLLLKLRTKVPDNYGAYLAGWNRDSVQAVSGTSFIGFHHPAGDVKKLSTTTSIQSNGVFNQTTTPNTHWKMNLNVGGVAGGSSGSALFDANGLVIGDLSGSPDENVCTADTRQDISMSQHSVLYSKLSRNWLYPEGNGASNAQLKIWLDPTGTNQTSVPSKLFTAACPASGIPTGITTANTELGNAISIYPNPVSTGVVRMKVNMAHSSDLTVTFYDISGAKKVMYNLSRVSNGEYSFDISGFANGTYLMQISSDNATTSKKVMLMH